MSRRRMRTTAETRQWKVERRRRIVRKASRARHHSGRAATRAVAVVEQEEAAGGVLEEGLRKVAELRRRRRHGQERSPGRRKGRRKERSWQPRRGSKGEEGERAAMLAGVECARSGEDSGKPRRKHKERKRRSLQGFNV